MPHRTVPMKLFSLVAAEWIRWRKLLLLSPMVGFLSACSLLPWAAEPVATPPPAEPENPVAAEAAVEAAGGASRFQLDRNLPSVQRELARLPQAPDMGDRAAGLEMGEALAIVWAQHPRVRQSELDLAATNFDISGARAGYYPYLSVQTEQRDDGDNTSIVRIVQPIWNGGLTGAQVDISRSRQRAALAQLNLARLELGLGTAEAYLNLAAANELDRQWRSYVQALEGLLDLIRRRAQQGVSPQSDEQTVQTRLSQARAGLQANRASMVAAQAQLASLIGAAPERVAWPEDRRLLSEYELQRIGRDQVEAHPSRQAAIAAIHEQEATARASKAALWPQLAIEHRRQLDGFVVDPNNDDATLLVMQYQTNNGLAGYRAFQADQERARAAEAALQTAIRDVNSAIAVARAERASALMQIDAQVAAAESAQALVDSFRRQFEVGRKSWLEVLNAQREANDAVLQAITVRRNLWVANARLALQGLYWRRLSDRAPALHVIEDEDSDE
jgi:outer membrane protein, adhesin transport system